MTTVLLSSKWSRSTEGSPPIGKQQNRSGTPLSYFSNPSDANRIYRSYPGCQPVRNLVRQFPERPLIGRWYWQSLLWAGSAAGWHNAKGS